MAHDAMTGFIQIWYKEEHLSHLYPFAIPYENKGLTMFFENDVIAKLIPQIEYDKIAICSWKLGQKMMKSIRLTKERIESDYQVLSFTRNGERHQMLGMANQWHPEFMKTITLLWEKLGFKMPGEARHPIYQNAFSAKREIYKQYVSEFLQPAIDLITTDEQLNELMLRPSKYSVLQRDADIKSVKAKLGLLEYPLCPFVLERCPSLWFTLNRIPVTYL